uniref:Uncharacterized protein n=1 Tax=Lepeophtheirus salmonis TaxID=72036 RepID=A0A0K2UG86_LEPSM
MGALTREDDDFFFFSFGGVLLFSSCPLIFEYSRLSASKLAPNKSGDISQGVSS